MITKETLDKLPKLANVAGEQNRVMLHSIYCDGDRLIATDGYCLAIVTPDKLDLEPAIIPLDAIRALEQGAELSIDAGTVTVKDDYMTRTWHVEGQYLDVDQIIPTVSPLTPYIELDARELLEVATKSHGHEYIILDSAGIVANQSKHEGGENGAVKVLSSRGSFSVAINASLLLDLAKSVMLPVKAARRDTYPIRLYDQLREYGPHVVKPVKAQEGFTSYGVIMPMHR